MSISNKIKALFESSDLKIKDLCAEIGISDPTYYRILKTNKTDTDTLQLIATYFKVPISYFFVDEADGVSDVEKEVLKEQVKILQADKRFLQSAMSKLLELKGEG